MSNFTNALLAVALLLGAAFVGAQMADTAGPVIIDEAPVVIDESSVGTSYTRFTDLDFTTSFAYGTFGNETEIIDADGNFTFAGSLTLENDEVIANAADGVVTVTGDDTSLDFQIITADSDASGDAMLTLDADAGGDAADTWILMSEANGNDFTITNHETELFNFTTAGNLQIDGDFEVTGDTITFGTNGATIENTGADALTITETSVNFSAAIDVAGTANLDNTDIDGTFALDGTTAVSTCSTSIINYTPLFRIGYDTDDYMLITTTQTSANVAITHPGKTPAITWTATSFDFAGTMALDATTLSDVLTFSDGATIDQPDANTLTLVETNITVDASTAALVDGATSARAVSAGFVSLEANDIRFGLNAVDYMKLVVTQTSSNVAITHTSTAAVTWTATSFDFAGTMALDATTLSDVLTFSDGGTVDNTDSTTLTLTEANISVAGNFAQDGATAVLDGSTSVRGVSAALTSLEAPDIRFGFNTTDYVKFAVTQTSSNLAITHTGTAAVTWTANTFDFIGTTALDVTTFGASGAGSDVTFYGAVASYLTWWDANADTNGTWYFGADDYGVDVVWYGQTQTESVTWDASADTWYFGASDDEGVDITAYGETAGAALDWDASDDALELDGTANITHKDATNAGALFISTYNLVYTQTGSAVTVFTLPAYSYVTEVKVMTTTTFNESGTLTCDIGWSGVLEGYAADLDIKTSDGWAYADVYSNFGLSSGSSARDILVSIADQNDNGTAGAATVYVEWTMAPPGAL